MFKIKKPDYKKASLSIIPEFDIWPPKPKKTDILKSKASNLPRNKSYRDPDTHQDTSDMAVYEPIKDQTKPQTTTDNIKKNYEDV